MLVECLTLRSGSTPVTVKDHIYEFMPIPGALDGEFTTSVANVANQEAVEYLIGNPEKNIKGRPNFRPYRPKLANDEMISRRKASDARSGRYKGYHVDVMNLMGNDKGYMIIHETESGNREFCGMNGVFSTDIQKIIPFAKISDADAFLRAMVDGMPLPTFVPVKAYPCREEGCVEEFDDPMQLADHFVKVHACKDEPVKVDPKAALEAKLGIEKQHYTRTPEG
jgi:hypothetical protein